MADRAEIAIIGAGFCGIGMAVRLMRAGYTDLTVLERADSVGGTWRENTYPGCQCDVPSHVYSLSFAPNPDWSRTYSHQSEIWDYLRRTAGDFGVTPRIRFGCEVRMSSWDEESGEWVLDTSQGEVRARFLIDAPGALAEPAVPELPGLERFQGTAFHSAEWDHEHDLTGERVAVIGTGASAIQFAPAIQPKVGRLHVFQRTPPWVMPHRDRPISRFERMLYRRFPLLQRIVRAWAYGIREIAVPAFAFDHRLNPPIQRIATRHMERQVADPELRRRLTPDYEIGCKRILPSNRWYPMLTQPNVELVTDEIAEVRERSIVSADGTEREVDTIIFGTGFQVLEMPAAHRVTGRRGETLAEAWDGKPEAYMGTSVADFPNMFMLLGPNTGLGTNSVVFMAEAQMQHVISVLDTMRAEGSDLCEVAASAQRRWNERIQHGSRRSVWTAGGCRSWYLDAEGRNRAIWPGYSWRFWQLARRIKRQDYFLGRTLRSAGDRDPGDGPAAAAGAAVPGSAAATAKVGG